MTDITSPIGTISPDFVHKKDGGALKVIAHDTVYTLRLNVYQCEVCDETMDVTDYECIGDKPSSEEIN